MLLSVICNNLPSCCIGDCLLQLFNNSTQDMGFEKHFVDVKHHANGIISKDSMLLQR